VLIELAPNHASLHDARLMHGSDANTSPLRRCGYTMRFMSASVRFDSDRFGDCHNIYLARGQDRAGNRYADPAQSYTHLARFRQKSGRNGH
jgi:ectoine hydroxylase-related dioxygenase (phytanoyl-CoA dioxygenase family)